MHARAGQLARPEDLIDLAALTGAYQLTSAGHPPALVWSAAESRWAIDPAHGTALGILPRPHLVMSAGVLRPGEALMFYTDGVVESRLNHLDEGVAWLQDAAATAISPGFEGSADRILQQVSLGDDDRAVLILERTAPLVGASSSRDELAAR